MEVMHALLARRGVAPARVEPRPQALLHALDDRCARVRYRICDEHDAGEIGVVDPAELAQRLRTDFLHKALASAGVNPAEAGVLTS